MVLLVHFLIKKLKVDYGHYLGDETRNDHFGELVAQALSFAEVEGNERVWVSGLAAWGQEVLAGRVETLRQEFVWLVPLVWVLVGQVLTRYDD